MVTIYVDGRPVQVPEHTSASEIRRIARSDGSRPLAKAGNGRNTMVSGELDVAEGDRFIVGRPFTKGMQKFKVLSSKKQRKSDRSMRLIFPQPKYERMVEAFRASEAQSRECYAIAQCGYRVDSAHKQWDYLVRSVHVPAREDLFEQSSITVTPKAEFVENICSEAAEKGNMVLEIHTHVGSREPNFSWIDIENGLENGRFLKSCGMRFAMAVVGNDGFSFCEYDADHDAIVMPESARICVLGRNGLRDALVHKSSTSCEIPATIRPSTVRVAVAGLDGVGFGICQELARQGVRDFVLLDDGIVEESGPSAGRKRTRAAMSMLKKNSKDISAVNVNDIAKNARNALKECDAIFYCGGDKALRAIVTDVSLKFFIPCIEARSLKQCEGSPYGRVRVLVPSVTGCGACHGDAECGDAVYIDARVESTVCSIAVKEFMDLLAGNARESDLFEYDSASQSLHHKRRERDEACPLCGPQGVLGTGDERRPRKS